jgi:hypothetical protein
VEVNEAMSTTGLAKEYPEELSDLLHRAAQGDEGAVPALSVALDLYPELSRHFGDLVMHAERPLLLLASGGCPLARDAIAREQRALRKRLCAQAGSQLERLLAARLSLDWLDLQLCQLDVVDLGSQPHGPAARAAQERLSRAHARFLASSKALATVSRLLRRAPSPLELLGAGQDGAPRRKASKARPELLAALG